DGIDLGAELVQAEGFDDVTGMGQVEDLELGLDAQVRRGDDDRKLGLGVANAAEELDPVGIRKPHVQHRDVGPLLLQLDQRFRARAGEDQVVARGEVPLVTQPESRLVLDDQHAPALRSIFHAAPSLQYHGTGGTGGSGACEMTRLNGRRTSVQSRNGRRQAADSSSKRSASLVSTSRNRSSSLAFRSTTRWRRSAARRWISMSTPRPAESTCR